MRIGLDFDNTLAQYDHVFAAEAKLGKLVPTEWKGNKKELREYLFSIEEGEHLWKKIQGKVYGPNMLQAKMSPGIAQFFVRCKYRGDDLFIVSHKTEYGHYDPTKTPLREIALEWMELQGFFNKNKFGLTKDRVFFEKTREEKVNQITSLKLDVFVDDLKEVFTEKEFPNIVKILFSTAIDEELNVISCNNWTAIAHEVLGPITNEECKELAQTILNINVSEVKKIQGRGNSRIYKIVTEKDLVYAMKFYPDLMTDPRNRIQSEVQSFQLLESLHLTPKVTNFDEELNIALFEWIDGEALDSIENEHIDQALDFVEKLQELDPPDYFQTASEACTSAEQLFNQIESRFSQFEILEDEDLLHFLHSVFKPLYNDVKKWSEQHWPANNLREKLPSVKKTLSPADFGFHNSILQSNGKLCFLDFEYFGWDDPVKLIAEFIWHPAMSLSNTQKKRWLEKSFKIFNDTEEIQKRFHAAWPLYGMRWAMILLNEFHDSQWEKRVLVNEKIEHLREERLSKQIDKAKAFCALIKSHKLECPYV